MMSRRRALSSLLALLAVGAWTSACDRQPRTFRELQRRLPGTTDPAARTALIEQYIAGRSNPIIEDNSRLVFFVKDDGSGRQPRIIGDFNAWSTGPQGYDQTAGTPTRVEGTPWSYLDTSGYSNSRLEYVFLYDKDNPKMRMGIFVFGDEFNSSDSADVVILGVSRTSKTPTSIYLANRGIRTANVPLVSESGGAKTIYANVADGWAASGDAAALLAGTVVLNWRTMA
mgnify:CR=1 FL=1